MSNEIIRLGVPIGQQLLKMNLTKNQLKLIVALQHEASVLPDREDGEDTNIFTEPEFRKEFMEDKELAPLWKQIEIPNWNNFLDGKGFKSINRHRLKEDLYKIAERIPLPEHPIWFENKRYKVVSHGARLIRTKEIIHEKSGNVKEFIVMVGGYTPILNKYWQTISPKFLFYRENPNPSTWRFIISFGGAIRHEYVRIINELAKYGSLEFYRLTLNLQKLEHEMGIVGQNNKYKGKAWRELLTIMGITGVELIDGIMFPLDKVEDYELEDVFIDNLEVKAQVKGIDKYSSLQEMPLEMQNMLTDYQSEEKDLQDTLNRRSKAGNPHIGFLLTRKMLYEWLPIRGL